MAAISITRGREIITGKERYYRGVGTFNSTDTTGTLTIPKGNIVGFTGTSVIATSTAVAYSLDGGTSNGVLSCTGSITVRRSAGTDSAGKFFFRVDYDT